MKSLPVKYKPNPISDIHTIYTFHKYLEWPTCVKTMDTKTMKSLNVWYKLYSSIYLVMSFIGLVWCYSSDVGVLMVKAPNSLLWTTYLNYFTGILVFVMTLINCVFMMPEKGVDIYRALTKIDTIVDIMNKKNRSKLLKIMIFIHVVYLTIRSVQFFYDIFVWPDFSLFVYYATSVSIDLKFINFVIISHLVAVRFEVLNAAMMNLKFCEGKSSFDLKYGILISWWYPTVDGYFVGDKNMNISSFLALYNRLADLIDDINAYFGVPVSFFEEIC